MLQDKLLVRIETARSELKRLSEFDYGEVLWNKRVWVDGWVGGGYIIST